MKRIRQSVACPECGANAAIIVSRKRGNYRIECQGDCSVYQRILPYDEDLLIGTGLPEVYDGRS